VTINFVVVVDEDSENKKLEKLVEVMLRRLATGQRKCRTPVYIVITLLLSFLFHIAGMFMVLQWFFLLTGHISLRRL
jgi:hypothetical protein